jgi:hypothetical protein
MVPPVDQQCIDSFIECNNHAGVNHTSKLQFWVENASEIAKNVIAIAS